MKKVVPKLRQKVKVDIVTRDDIKIYYTEKFQDFTARYMIKWHKTSIQSINSLNHSDLHGFIFGCLI